MTIQAWKLDREKKKTNGREKRKNRPQRFEEEENE